MLDHTTQNYTVCVWVWVWVWVCVCCYFLKIFSESVTLFKKYLIIFSFYTSKNVAYSWWIIASRVHLISS